MSIVSHCEMSPLSSASRGEMIFVIFWIKEVILGRNINRHKRVGAGALWSGHPYVWDATVLEKTVQACILSHSPHGMRKQRSAFFAVDACMP